MYDFCSESSFNKIGALRINLVQGILHECAISVFTRGPMLRLMLCCHYLEILDDSEERAPFLLSIGQHKSCPVLIWEFVLNRVTHSVPQWEVLGEGQSGWIPSYMTDEKCQIPP